MATQTNSHFSSHVTNYMTHVLSVEEIELINEVTTPKLTTSQFQLLSEMKAEAEVLSEKVNTLATDIIRCQSTLDILKDKIEEFKKEKSRKETGLGIAGFFVNTLKFGTPVVATGLGAAAMAGAITISGGAAAVLPVTFTAVTSVFCVASKSIGEQKKELESISLKDIDHVAEKEVPPSEEMKRATKKTRWDIESISILSKCPKKETKNALQKLVHIIDTNPTTIHEYTNILKVANEALEVCRAEHQLLSTELAKVGFVNSAYKVSSDLKEIAVQYWDTFQGKKRPQSALPSESTSETAQVKVEEKGEPPAKKQKTA